MLVNCRVTTTIYQNPFFTWVERGTTRIKCLTKEQNIMTPEQGSNPDRAIRRPPRLRLPWHLCIHNIPRLIKFHAHPSTVTCVTLRVTHCLITTSGMLTTSLGRAKQMRYQYEFFSVNSTTKNLYEIWHSPNSLSYITYSCSKRIW